MCNRTNRHRGTVQALLFLGALLLPGAARATLTGGAGAGAVADYSGIAVRTGGAFDPLPVQCHYRIVNNGTTPSTRNYQRGIGDASRHCTKSLTGVEALR